MKRLISLIIVVTVVAVALAVVAPPRSIAQDDQLVVYMQMGGTQGDGTTLARTNGAIAAAEAGASVVDGALGGLGGCPFAPGASGNTASEDLLFATRPSWLSPEVFADIVRLGENIVAELDEPNRSRARQGARSEAEAFEWVVRA
mgnify:CR=1 FL=1